MNKELIYQTHYYQGTRDELKTIVAAHMSQRRFEHVLRVEAMACQLAKRWQVSIELASVAALTHDYAKERSDADFKQMIMQEQLDPDLLNWGNNIWHGIVGAEMVKQELGILNPDILEAIRQHTTGGVEMSPLSQVLYMADYVEAGRDFPGVSEVRALAMTDLKASVGWQAAHTLAYLINQRVSVYPMALLTYNAWSIEKR
ncbi:bis(5'-nucleosyl)-tetraphosphatase (symmetrical) YqeK [Weissella diestrammenae]|uniref:bis(5'-nucleosyl)-tetraphosphatase (symmetrical) n=1 Tax=Weissella diestrammenae TaxID=1162633 RepID=A0A7G9T692_9LACO|nr:bis(5'-nucleosyl)-tetraphosphatase (symmetrical) YqeK [Weissella diestrammenae]MCM0583337.1 bis(5'-nucleosyl)-tetraphosphatase (symmetrical) YqeK [Weissella diestrammenae]QNN75617.1 bis(5'-nucleosyl)-tetraphosphatase (symmetrical) YqeK [Weissella diestrammenae]